MSGEQYVPAIGTRARVIIEGTVEAVNLDENPGVGVITAGRYGAWVSGDDPDVRLVLDPEVRALPGRETAKQERDAAWREVNRILDEDGESSEYRAAFERWQTLDSAYRKARASEPGVDRDAIVQLVGEHNTYYAEGDFPDWEHFCRCGTSLGRGMTDTRVRDVLREHFADAVLALFGQENPT